MTIPEFEKLVADIDNYTPNDIKNFKFMSDEEIIDLQYEIEKDTGNYSNWDILRAFITFKNKLIIERNDS